MAIVDETQTGPYRHAKTAKAEKVFDGGRKFTVLVAAAYDAGIVGYEHNGIVVIDENHGNILLDRHFEASSGYFGPTKNQLQELARVMAMEWSEFSDFVTSNPRYRGTLPDAGEPEPIVPPGLASRIVFPDSEKAGGEHYPMPLSDRKDIIEFLSKHAAHRVDGPHSKIALAWNVKVYGFDSSGKDDGYEPDPNYDERWEEYIQDPEMFFEEASDVLHSYLHEPIELYDGRWIKADVYTAGRSGGWLIVTGIDGADYTWNSTPDMVAGLDELTDKELVDLYKLVCKFDVGLAEPGKQMAAQYAFRRECMEEQWAAEAKPGV